MASSDARRAFTLMEVMITVGIIILLVSILIPALGYAKTAAKKSATSSLLNSIQMGLNQYYSDFNMFPVSSAVIPPANTVNVYASIPAGRGPAMLAEGLMGYLQSSTVGNTDGAGTGISVNDPHFGFRTRTGGLGKIYGPYAPDDPKSYRINSDVAANADQSFVDPFGHEILYYRATGIANLPTTTSIFAALGTNALFNSDDDATVYNADLTTSLINASAASSTPFFQSLGGRTSNALNTGTAPVTGATTFLLISASADGNYFSADDMFRDNR